MCSNNIWLYSFSCESALGEFLKGIGKNPQRLDYPAMVNILITHSQSNGQCIVKEARNKPAVKLVNSFIY